MGADQRGNSPDPVIPVTWGADGNTYSPLSAANPLPTTPAGAAAATTENDVNGTLGAASSFTWATNASRRSLLIVNTGATNSLYVAAGASADNTKFELKPGAGIRFDNNDGAAQRQRTIFSTGGTTYSYVEVIA